MVGLVFCVCGFSILIVYKLPKDIYEMGSYINLNNKYSKLTITSQSYIDGSKCLLQTKLFVTHLTNTLKEILEVNYVCISESFASH